MYSTNNLIIDSVNVIFNAFITVFPTTALARSHTMHKNAHFIFLEQVIHVVNIIFGFYLL